MTLYEVKLPVRTKDTNLVTYETVIRTEKYESANWLCNKLSILIKNLKNSQDNLETELFLQGLLHRYFSNDKVNILDARAIIVPVETLTDDTQSILFDRINSLINDDKDKLSKTPEFMTSKDLLNKKETK